MYLSESNQAGFLLHWNHCWPCDFYLSPGYIKLDIAAGMSDDQELKVLSLPGMLTGEQILKIADVAWIADIDCHLNPGR